MKYKMKWCAGPTSGFTFEEVEVDTNDAEKDAVQLLQIFNVTRRPGELRRTVCGVEVLDLHSIRDHDWRKSSLVTQTGQGMNWDTMKCERCGVTGKRYGLGQDGVRIDFKYKAKKYQRCDTAMEALGIQ